MKIFVGIDYSLTSPGVTVCRGTDFKMENIHLNYLTKIKKAANYSGKVPLNGTFYFDYTSEEDRLDKISDWAMKCIPPSYDGIHVCLEGYSYNSTGAAIFQIAENAGLLKHKIFKAGYALSIISPNELKKHATGRGNATKLMMETAFIKDTGINIRDELKQTADNPSSDIIDSYYLCRYAIDHIT